jgi:2-(1,2-epoxy-1,2-dihydrophenyl)acetyl-CoA isomerase
MRRIPAPAAPIDTAQGIGNSGPICLPTENGVTYETIDLQIRDGVAWIVLNRPEALNALDLRMARELFDISNRLSSDRAVRAAVLTGSGATAFCAGGDVAGFAADPPNTDRLVREMTTYLHAAVSRFAAMDPPLIAAVNGVAAGGGLSLVACCDLAVSADHARYTSAYTQIGLSPDGSSSWYLARMVGLRRATELYLTNRVLSAVEALEWGLVNRVVPAAALRDEAGALAARFAQGPTRAYGGVKKLMLTTLQESLEGQMERESRQIAELSMTADSVEGVRAFLDKRAPRFGGR